MGVLMAFFWGLTALFIGIGVAVVHVPSVPVLLADGSTTDLTSTLIRAEADCTVGFDRPECVQFWADRNVTLSQLQAIDRAESKRLLFALPILAFVVPLIIAQVRRHHDRGQSGAYVLLNLIPCVGFVFSIINFVQEGQPHMNQYGPPPKSGVNWKSLYGAKATS